MSATMVLLVSPVGRARLAPYRSRRKNVLEAALLAEQQNLVRLASVEIRHGDECIK
jgi:hypothetical protein